MVSKNAWGYYKSSLSSGGYECSEVLETKLLSSVTLPQSHTREQDGGLLRQRPQQLLEADITLHFKGVRVEQGLGVNMRFPHGILVPPSR